jgi:hypothetical protein
MDLRYASPWFVSFIQRLLERQPAVIELLCADGFAKEPADLSFFRIALYQYRFTDRTESLIDGTWWHRRLEWRSPTYRVSRTKAGLLEIRPQQNEFE